MRAGLCTVALMATTVAAQEHPIAITASPRSPDAAVRPGANVVIVVHAHIPVGWHLYSLTQPPGGPMATTINVGPSSLVRIAAPVDAAIPRIAPDQNFPIISETYDDSAIFSVRVAVSPSAAAGEHTIEVRVGYQTCTESYCLPPRTDTVRTVIRVAGAPVASAFLTLPVAEEIAPVAATAPLTGRTTGSSSLALFLWLAATMGALSLLTPCVFPMVPITVSYFSRTEQGRRQTAVRDAALYGGGIVGAFTGLGLGLALVFGVTGLNRLAANPWLNLAIAGLFIAFALSLFGVRHPALPHGLVDWLERRSRAGGVERAATTMLMGVTFAVTTFTCTAPFVGTLLVSAAQGNWRWPAAGLLVFSAVFALPFVVLALVPDVLTRLPRSGAWMVTLMGALGFIELAAALKFISNADLVLGWGVFTRNVVIASWLVIGVLLVAYLLGAGIRSRPIRWPARGHVTPAMLVLLGCVWLATGLSGRRLGELEAFLPPAGQNATGVAGENELAWLLDDYEGALAQARTEGKLVLIDFTGYTCTNCRWMEANMFPRAEVREQLERFVRVRLFTDGATDRHRRQQALELERFNTVALPLYAIVDSLGAARGVFLGMTRDMREFVRFLDESAFDSQSTVADRRGM